MYKAFIFKSGKILPSFNGVEYDTIDKIRQSIDWYYESKRGDQSAQFLIVKEDRVILIVNKKTDETER